MLPNSWTEVSLREVTLKPETWNPDRAPRATLRYVDVSSVSRESLAISETVEHTTESAPSRARKIVRGGDTIFATIRPTLKRIAHVPDRLDGEIVSTAFCVLRPDRKRIVPEFLYFAVQLDSLMDGVAACESGASYPAVRDTDVLDQTILLPPLSEQELIGAVLSRLWSAVSVEALAEETAHALKRAAMRSLFAGERHAEKQKETEVGPIPETWPLEPLGDLAEIVYGAQAAVANALDPSIGTPIFTNVNITLDGELDLTTLRYYSIPPGERQRLILRKGDVLFNWRSGSAKHVGKTAYFDLDGEYTFSSFILRFRPLRSVTGRFLYWWLSQLRQTGFFEAQRNVSSINSVFNASLSATIPIALPPPDEQRDIVAILDAIDNKIAVHKEKRAVLEALFRSLLNKLMTGAVRVSDVNLDALGCVASEAA